MEQPLNPQLKNHGKARRQERFKEQLAALQAAIDEGDASGIAGENVFERVRQTLGLPKTAGASGQGHDFPRRL